MHFNVMISADSIPYIESCSFISCAGRCYYLICSFSATLDRKCSTCALLLLLRDDVLLHLSVLFQCNHCTVAGVSYMLNVIVITFYPAAVYLNVI